MAGQPRAFLSLALLLSLGACQGRGKALVAPAAPPVAAALQGHLGGLPLDRHVGPTGTLRLRLPPTSLGGRPLLAFVTSQRLRLIFMGPDLAVPLVGPAMDAFPSSVLTFPGVPVGKVRLVGLEWLDGQGQALNGGPQWALGSIVEGQDNAMAITPANQVAGEALAGLLPAEKASVEAISPTALLGLLEQAQGSLDLADLRMLDPGQVATTIKQGAGVLPAEAPAAWKASAMGQVALRPVDWPPHMNVKLFINDALSGEVILNQSDTLLLGPIPARAQPYQVRAIPLDLDALGNYVEAPWHPAPVSVVVGAGAVAKATLSFSDSKAGAPLPLRLAPAVSGQVQVGGQPELWLVGGVTMPASLDGVASPPVLGQAGTSPSLKAWRFRRAEGWREVLTLPSAWPRLATAVGVGSDLFLFGGLDGSEASDRIWKLAAGANPPTLTPLATKLPFPLVGAAAGLVGDRVLLTGGLRTDGSAYPGVLSFQPSTGAVSDEGASANPEPLMDVAAVGHGNRLYLFGGARPGGVGSAQPSNRVWAYDSVTKDFRPLRRMPTARRGASAVVVGDKLYVIGGDELRSTPSTAVERFELSLSRWSHRPPLRVGRGRPGVALVPSAEGLPSLVVAGGGQGMPTAFGGESPVAAQAVEELAP